MKAGDRVKVRANAPEKVRAWLGSGAYALLREIKQGHWIAKSVDDGAITDVYEDEMEPNAS